MNKTVTVNISGIIFHIEEQAYAELQAYLEALRQQFRGDEGGDEIVADIEARIAELFQELLNERKHVITAEDVANVTAQLGNPGDFEGAGGAESYGTDADANAERTSSEHRKLYRDEDDKVVAGVCSGLGHYFGIDPIIPRVIFVLALFAGFGFLTYIIIWIAVPAARTTSEKLRMKRRDINVDNIRTQFQSEPRNSELNRAASRFLEVLTDILRGLATALRAFFGVLFVIISIALGMGILSTLLGIGVFVDLDFILTTEQVYDFFIPNKTGFEVGFFGMVLVHLALMIGFLFAGLKMLRRISNRYDWLKWVAPVCFITGGLLVGFGVAKNVTQFSNEGEVLAQLTATSSDTQQFELYFTNPNDLEILYDNRNGFPPEFAELRGETMYLGDRVDIAYRPTTDSLMHVTVNREARGPSRTEAHHQAERIDLDVRLDSNRLTISPFIGIPNDDGWHFQRAEVVIFLPEGASVEVDPALYRFQHHYSRHVTARSTSEGIMLFDMNGATLREEPWQHNISWY